MGDISFIPLLTVVGLAFVVPIVLARFKTLAIPVVVGEILAGIVVGKSGLHWVRSDAVLTVLAELGFVYLMFLSGLELDFSEVLSDGRKQSNGGPRTFLGSPIFLGSMLFALTLLVSVAAAFVLQAQALIQDPWIMALILSTTSLGVVVPVLKERGLTSLRYGQAILISALVADFASIFLISIYVLLRTRGISTEILLILVLFVAFGAVHRLAMLFRRHLPTERIFEELSSATSQIQLRGSFVMALVFIVLAESLGIENILGAFLAGVIISLLLAGESSLLREKLDAVGYGFFIPIFFVMVGVNFDLPVLFGSPAALALVPLLIGIAYLVKSIPALLFRLQFSWRETLAAGMLLSSRLSLIIAAATIATELGAISPEIDAAIILVAVITCTLSPVLFNRISPTAPPTKNRIILVGSQQGAGLLAARLQRHGQETVFVALDHSEDQPSRSTVGQPIGSHKGLLTELQEAGIDQARALVVMEGRDADNLRLCRLARRMYGVETVISWVRNPTRNHQFYDLGVRVVNPDYATLLIMEGMVLDPDMFSIASDEGEASEVREVKLMNPDVIGKRVSDLNLLDGAAILTIRRGDDILVPDGTTRLRANDRLILMGTKGATHTAARHFARWK